MSNGSAAASAATTKETVAAAGKKLRDEKKVYLSFIYQHQCCGSGMFIPDPDFYPSRISNLGSRIPDPKTATKERDEKN